MAENEVNKLREDLDEELAEDLESQIEESKKTIGRSATVLTMAVPAVAIGIKWFFDNTNSILVDHDLSLLTTIRGISNGVLVGASGVTVRQNLVNLIKAQADLIEARINLFNL